MYCIYRHILSIDARGQFDCLDIEQCVLGGGGWGSTFIATLNPPSALGTCIDSGPPMWPLFTRERVESSFESHRGMSFVSIMMDYSADNSQWSTTATASEETTELCSSAARRVQLMRGCRSEESLLYPIDYSTILW